MAPSSPSVKAIGVPTSAVPSQPSTPAARAAITTAAAETIVRVTSHLTRPT